MPRNPNNINPNINSTVLYCDTRLLLFNLKKNKKILPKPRMDIKVIKVNKKNKIYERIKIKINQEVIKFNIYKKLINEK